MDPTTKSKRNKGDQMIEHVEGAPRHTVVSRQAKPRPAPSTRPLLSAALAIAAAVLGLAPAAPAIAAPADLAQPDTQATGTVDHATWDRLLKAYVKPGADGVNRVDYAAFKASGQADLKRYIAALEKVDPRTLSRNAQFAFWANLYNAKTIDIVLAHYPVDSIRKITINEGLLGFLKKSVGAGGPWKAKVVEVAGEKLSLDNIEHDILRPAFKDPRVHYAVNCASFGCPNLSQAAFTADNLNAELDAGARAYVNHPRGISVEAGKVTASSIYSWFQVDFGGSERGVLDHVRTYASDDLKARLEGIKSISGYRYDWSLNDIRQPSPQG